jgi:glycosyltransferase involved in cell wall biosynthesis
MPRVLIPSDCRDFIDHWVRAYGGAGWDVVAGAYNFDLRAARFDLVHFQWPEELCVWKPPTEARLGQVIDGLLWWARQGPTIATANNYYPHGHEGHPLFRRLYNAFYRHCNFVIHYSEASRELARREFPDAGHERHVVVGPFNYDDLLAVQKARGSCRRELGLSEQDFVVLVFGALRSREEVKLVTRAFRLCKDPRKRLLMAGRYHPSGGKVRRRLREWGWKSWLWRTGAVTATGYIPDEELYRYLDSADVVIVPRLDDLTSGIPMLAMTFGRMVIAPAHGAFPEYLAGTDNLLYRSGDAADLAAALSKAAGLDREAVGKRNREVADRWRWSGIIRACLDGVERFGRPTPQENLAGERV